MCIRDRAGTPAWPASRSTPSPPSTRSPPPPPRSTSTDDADQPHVPVPRVIGALPPPICPALRIAASTARARGASRRLGRVLPGPVAHGPIGCQVGATPDRAGGGKLGEPGRHVTGVDPLEPGSQPELV